MLCIYSQVTEANCRLVPDEPLRSGPANREAFHIREEEYDEFVAENTRRWVEYVEAGRMPHSDDEEEEIPVPEPAVPDVLLATYGVEEVEFTSDDEVPAAPPSSAFPRRSPGRPRSVRSGGAGRPRVIRPQPAPPPLCNHPPWMPMFDRGDHTPHCLGIFGTR